MTASRTPVLIASLLLSLGMGIVLGACGPHSEYRINKVCKRYCYRAVDCNNNVVLEDCFDDCVNEANSCESDGDVESALDILEDCTNGSCNEAGACTLEAWIECNL